jgi:hypothetical protein
MSNDNTQGGAEPSLASAGSHGEPVAWGIQFWDGSLHGEVFQTFEAAEKHLNPPHSPLRREDVTAKIVALLVAPALTDEEREAMSRAAVHYGWQFDDYRDPTDADTAKTIRGILARLK